MSVLTAIRPLPLVRRMVPGLALALGITAPDICAAEATAAPLFNLEDHVQSLADDNFEFHVTLKSVFGENSDVRMTLALAGGEWQVGSASGMNQSRHVAVAGSDLASAGGRVTGTVDITIKPDRWVPTDLKEHTISLQVDVGFERHRQPSAMECRGRMVRQGD